MLKNYFKTAWRNLINNKVYSALNIVGLAAGMAVALLIGLWGYYQYSYNRFLPNYNNVYKARIKYTENGETKVGPATAMPLAEILKKDIPGVRYVAQTDWMGAHGLVVGDKKLYPSGAMAGADFLNIFQYPLLKGNAGSVLQEPYSIVLTESTAKALFGNDDPVGKTVRIDNRNDLKVTGVLKDLPPNSTLKFSFLVPFSYYIQTEEWVKNAIGNFKNNSFQTFVAMDPNVSVAQFERELKKIVPKYAPEAHKQFASEVIFHSLGDWHLYSEFENGVPSGGFIDYVKLFSIIGALVLLIACINFMNLSTARSEKRAREVGVRKAIGSGRNHLIFQFLIESLLITAIAAILSLLFVQLALAPFNALTRTSVAIPYSNSIFWIIMTSYVLFTGILAGSRPAFYLSSFKPIKVLKGTVQTGRSAILSRQALVVIQFTCSIALIISTIIIYQQIQYAKDRPTGFDVDRLMMSDASTDLSKNYSALKNDLLKSGVVVSVTKSSSPVTEIWSNNDVLSWQGKRADETLGLGTIGVTDADYFKTMGITLTQGRNFTGDLNVDSASVLINEAAVKRMRFKDPINQVITMDGDISRLTVIGVVKDAMMASPYAPAEPSIFTFSPGWSSMISYRLASHVSTKDALAKLEPLFNKYNPSFPYRYRFADEAYASKFSLETLIGKLAGVFAMLAIFISCLGLFGLATYVAEQRRKEIGIRKVLGASVSQVWVLLSKDFVLLVLISCVIASPLAFYFLQDWLQKYPYRISIGAGVFIVAATLAIFITIITISFQAIKAAIANPVKSLRAE